MKTKGKSKEVSVKSFNLPSGKLICGRFEDEAGARGFCKNCGGTHHQHRFARKFEHPPLTEAEKAHNAGAASISSSYWPASKPTSEVEGKGKLPAFGIRRVIWGGQ